MPTQNLGLIRSFELPQGFVPGAEETGTRGRNWLRSYHPAGTDAVQLTMAYSGFPLNERESQSLRAILASEPRDIFVKDAKCDEAARLEAELLSPALGNAGNNQISNTEAGYAGPIFELERLSLVQLDVRTVVRAWGWFHSTDRIPKNHFTGIFFDASPDQPEARIEELYLQARSQELFDEHRAGFEMMLASVRFGH